MFVLDGAIRSDKRRPFFDWEDKCFEGLQILYSNPSTKADAYTLIDDLLREGGSAFWKLKEIIK